MSRAERLKVGSLVVKDQRIISMGWNGTPSGFDNVCEMQVPEQVDLDSRTVTEAYTITKPEVIHAEQNALVKISRSNESSNGAVMFCTHSPCIDCAKLICQSGIIQVYYKHNYRNRDGLDLLKKANIEIIHYESKTR